MDFTELTEYLESIGEKYDIPGWQCAVAYKGKIVYSECGGYKDRENKKEMKITDPLWLFSATKVSTAVAVMQLIEAGKLSLDTRLCDVIPEYRNLRIKTENGFKPVMQPVTVLHLLTMTGGFTYDGAPCVNYIANHPNAGTVEILKNYAITPLAFEPGTHFNYSMCHDILGAVVEQVSGIRFAEYVRLNILEPLGMKSSYYVTPEIRASIGTVYAYNGTEKKAYVMEDQGCKYRFSDNYDSAGAGIVGYAEDYVRLPGALANGGIWEGKQIIKPQTIEEMRTPRLEGAARMDFARWYNRPGYNYALGVRALVDPAAAKAEMPAGEFGWDGAAGAFVAASPETGIGICYAMHVRACGVGYHKIHPAIRDLAYQCVTK